MQQHPINERISFLLKSLHLSARAFSEKIGEKPTITQNYVGTRNSMPGVDYIEKVLLHFESINPTWLLTGQGEPFLSTDPENISTQFDAKKISRSQVIANNRGKATINGTDCEKDLAAAQKEIALLNSQLADKERTIQILLKQTS